MKPQDRNLAEDWIDKEWSKIYQECMDSDGFLNDVKIKRFIRNVEAKTQQETVKGCLEEARRMNYHGECVNCKCIVPNQMINAIKAKYPTKE